RCSAEGGRPAESEIRPWRRTCYRNSWFGGEHITDETMDRRAEPWLGRARLLLRCLPPPVGVGGARFSYPREKLDDFFAQAIRGRIRARSHGIRRLRRRVAR